MVSSNFGIFKYCLKRNSALMNSPYVLRPCLTLLLTNHSTSHTLFQQCLGTQALYDSSTVAKSFSFPRLTWRNKPKVSGVSLMRRATSITNL